jgi:hypothetical protein
VSIACFYTPAEHGVNLFVFGENDQALAGAGDGHVDFLGVGLLEFLFFIFW